jgi:hypothetical protein
MHYTTRDFPWRYWWLEATKACLFRLAAEFHRRNRLAYQAGGTQIDDHGTRAQEYDQAAEAIWQRYEAWVRQVKIALNLDQCMTTEASPYAIVSRGWYPLP